MLSDNSPAYRILSAVNLQASVLSGIHVIDCDCDRRRAIQRHSSSRILLVYEVKRTAGEMPDAYENINMAMRSILTTDIGDNEDPYFQFNGNTSTHSGAARFLFCVRTVRNVLGYVLTRLTIYINNCYCVVIIRIIAASLITLSVSFAS